MTAVDIIPEKVELINNKKSPIQDEYIEKYLAEKELDLTATLDAKEAYPPPHHPPPWGAHLGRANAPGPGRSEDQAQRDETILHGWHGGEKCDTIILSKKVRIPLAREGKISLAMRNQTMQRTKMNFAEGWQTRGT